MKNIFIIILATSLSLNAQNENKTKPQPKDIGKTSEQAKEMAKDIGISDQQIESAMETSDTDLDNQVVEETPFQTTLEIIEIDGVKYIKDGLRYLPVLSKEYEAVSVPCPGSGKLLPRIRAHKRK